MWSWRGKNDKNVLLLQNMKGENNNLKQYSDKEVMGFIQNKKSDFWVKEGQKRSLALFKEVAKRVPAYKDFLRKNNINPAKIKTWEDFQTVPSVDKKNYLKQYPLKDLCWDGTLAKPLVFTSTSGSTGEPFYFPRGEQLDWQSSVVHELFLNQGETKDNEPTLVLVCFGMGVWIGGILTYQAFEMASRRNGHPVSILTPGINKEEIFKALKKLGKSYKKVIMIGYPPFMKDIIDEAPGQGIDLTSLNVRMIFAAEVFTESFRDYISQKLKMKNPYLDIMHIYGSADIGSMAWETTAGTLIKRLALKDKKVFDDIFSSSNKVPTLAQFNPLFVNFEEQNGEILLTGDNAVPLIRYAIGDRGGVLSFNEMVSKLENFGYDFKKEAKKVGIDNFVNELPFVYVCERIDFSTTIYGLQIFPEMIRDVFFDSIAQDYLTGKFALVTKFDENQDQYLEINLELKRDKMVNDKFKKMLTDKIVSTLCIKSSEFNELHGHLENRSLPRLVFWPTEHQTYFKSGIKQKWVSK